MPDTEKVAEEVEDKVADKAGEAKGNGKSSLAKKLITPAAAGLGTLAASYAARKGPELIKEKVMPRLEGEGENAAETLGRSAAAGAKEEAGGGFAAKAIAKVVGGDAAHDVQGWGKGRRLPIQYSIDVAVPVKVAYETWLDFEQLPEFMHRVESVEQDDEDHVVWHENIWGVRRDWKAEIVARRPNEMIAWRSTSRGGNAGVVTFHKLSDRLTRVEVNFDFQPQGVLEKLSSGLRFHRRAAKTDLKRFKAYVEMRENADAGEAGGGEQEGSRRERRRSPTERHEARDEERKKREERREQRRESGGSD